MNSLNPVILQAGRRNGHAGAGEYVLNGAPTTATEQFLLFVIAAVFPLENQLPSIMGYSVSAMAFYVLVLYIFINRQTYLTRVLFRPPLLAAYSIIIVGLIMEPQFYRPDYDHVWRILFMVGGAVLVSVLCRDIKSAQALVLGYIVSSLFIGVTAFLSMYFSLAGAIAHNFNEASRVRTEVMGDTPFSENANRLSFVIGQAGVFALVFALTTKRIVHRNLWLGLGTFSIVSAMLPMSRSGIAIIALQLVAIVLLYRGNLQKGIIIALVIGVVVFNFVPDVVFKRLEFSWDKPTIGKTEGRARVYRAMVDNFPRYAVYGLGAGYFWTYDGNNGFFKNPKVSGLHNSYAQIWVYWGLPGIITWMLMVILSAKRIPPTWFDRRTRMLIWVMGVGVVLMMLITHRLSAKEYAIALGLVTGIDYWMIEPTKRAIRLGQIPVPVHKDEQ